MWDNTVFLAPLWWLVNGCLGEVEVSLMDNNTDKDKQIRTQAPWTVQRKTEKQKLKGRTGLQSVYRG